MQRIIERFQDTPIAVYDAAWTLLEHNEPWAALHGDTRWRRGREANLVWQHFLGEASRIRHPALQVFEQSLVADLRDVTTRYPADRAVTEMVGALRTLSPRFADLWSQPAVSLHGNESKIVDHPEVGPIALDCDVLSVHGTDLRLVILTAQPGSEAAGKLGLLSVLGTEDMTSVTRRGHRAPARP